MTRANIVSILIASAAGAAAGALTTALMTPSTTLQTVSAAPAGDARLDEIAKAQGELQRAIAELRSSQELLAARPQRVVPGSDTSGARSKDDVHAAAVAAPAAPVESELSVEAALATLCDPNATYADRSAMWEKINKAGLLDAVVKSMEERVDREPNNAQLRVDLGKAYVQEIVVASEMGKGKWAIKADQAFDDALELDPTHWEARFTKAVALSHWPAIWGKKTQAISELETLVAQQNAGPKQEEHEQTYLFLGNLYAESGASAKAVEAWQKGLALFPDSVQLKQQLASQQHH